MPKTVVHNSSSDWSKTKNGGSVTTYTNYKPYKGLKKNVKKAEKKVNTLMKNGFNAPYQSQLNDTVGQINNSKFEYDISKDTIYNQYKDQFLAMGNQAMQEAQADATALTGGFANSYAQTAGQKAFNSYSQQLQNIVPQLYQQARTDYDANLSNLYNKASLLSGLNAQSYTEYATQLENAIANRDYAYNKYNTMRELSGTQVQKNKTWTKSSGGSSSTSKSGKK